MVWIVTSGSFSLKGSGSQVWIVGLEHMWARSLIQTLYFDSQPYSKMRNGDDLAMVNITSSDYTSGWDVDHQ